ncbi:MAG: nucleotide pyrophosphohydrolase [Firmicutes bacterium]|uniref:Nucleotide pyrophosphohydrolase n=1 Tax=Candidatus Alloenteromonas pullistercoris TaxID=2840785 RepID=A0A9D9DEH5_9FIRM|nr:nucleotide pyrophosphohydrolase [Candidatus Enteromonas pullistercoris]
MDKLDNLNQEIKAFVDERDWNKFHSPANLAKSISIEANELLECFQWDEDHYDLDDVKDELADVINYCIQMGQVLNLDLYDIVLDKLEKTKKKYPVEKCKSIATKYNKL